MSRRWGYQVEPLDTEDTCQVPSCSVRAVVVTKYSNGRRIKHCGKHAPARSQTYTEPEAVAS